MVDQRIQYTEEMVGAGHPTKADTLNRLALAEHNTDGTHKSVSLSVSAPATPVAKTAYEDSIVNAWEKFDYAAGVPAVTDDVNISSNTDNGAGDLTGNFATAMANATYGEYGQGESSGRAFTQGSAGGQATTSMRIFILGAEAEGAVDRDGSIGVVGN